MKIKPNEFGKFFLLASLCLFALPVFAYYFPGSPSGFVNDYAQILTAEQKQALEQKLSQFEKETSNEISIVAIKSLKGDTVENFAEKLFKEWGIGKKNKDNGILLLIAKDDRKMKIEVGYGLEGALTDAQSFWIYNDILKPAFQQEKYFEGVSDATDKIIAATKGEYIPSAQDNSKKNDFNFDLVWIGVFFLIWISSMLARSKSWWAGGVVGAIIGAVLIFVFSWLVGLIAIAILTPLGLLFDFFISKNYSTRKSRGLGPSWWAGGFGGGKGGFGGGSGGGFGGFGGGSSGGGGSGGSW